jgi:hypothetical protein
MMGVATKRSRVQRVLLGLLGLIAGAFIVEGFVSVALLSDEIRALRPPPTENFRQAAYDSLVGWIGLPDLSIRDNFGPGLTLTTNHDGLRIHRPIAAERAANERRVMCSGASFTFGSGVSDSDTFCARLEHEFPGVRTINVAQRGYGLDQSYLWYRRDGARFPHDVQMFAVNATDFDRTALANLTGYPKPTLAIKDGALIAENVPVPQWAGWSRAAQVPQLLPDLRVFQLVVGRMAGNAAAQARRIDERLFPVVDALLADLVRLNAERGSTLCVVYLPTVEEYVPGLRDERRERLGKSAQQAGIAFIDLTPDLRAVPTDSVDWMFITNNALPIRGIGGHYTAAGHRWLAARLAAHLRAQATIAPLLAASPRRSPQ